MLNRYSPQARENVREYFLSIVDYEYLKTDCGITIPENNFPIAAAVIWAKFKREVLDGNELYKTGSGSRSYWFRHWLAGLPGCIDSFFLGDAITDLCMVLEYGPQDPTPNIDSSDAEKMLSHMIYHELWEALF